MSYNFILNNFESNDSISYLENIYYFIYIFIPIISASTFILKKTKTPDEYLYLNFKDKVKIIKNNYYLYYVLIGYTFIFLCSLAYSAFCSTLEDKLDEEKTLLPVLLTIILFSLYLTYILIDFIAKILCTKYLMIYEGDKIKKELKFNFWGIQVFFLIIELIILFPIKGIIVNILNITDYNIMQTIHNNCYIMQITISAILLSLTWFIIYIIKLCDTPILVKDEPIDYRNCKNIKIHLNETNKIIKFKKELKKGDFMMIINENNDIYISNRKVTKRQRISHNKVDRIEFIYLDEKDNKSLQYNAKKGKWEMN